MKKRFFAGLLACLLLLPACSGNNPPPPAEEDGALHILATTYPMYLFTTAVTEGVEGVEVSLLVNAQTACLHDYTLTTNDMKAIEKADVIVMNGVGLEDFMNDALAKSDAVVIDCSGGLGLLPAPNGEEGYDPHIWMDPVCATSIMGNLSLELAGLTYGEDWTGHGDYHTALLTAKDKVNMAAQRWSEALEGLTGRELITFHDGFQYFAHSQYMNLTILKSIEEEEGSEASAADIKEIVGLVEEYGLPAIFTEKNGSDATARAIARETGAEVYQLDMLMSGDGSGIQPYLDAMEGNVNTILEALG